MVKDSDIDEENKQPKKESDLVKFLKKRSFIYLACAVVSVSYTHLTLPTILLV